MKRLSRLRGSEAPSRRPRPIRSIDWRQEIHRGLTSAALASIAATLAAPSASAGTYKVVERITPAFRQVVINNQTGSKQPLFVNSRLNPQDLLSTGRQGSASIQCLNNSLKRLESNRSALRVSSLCPLNRAALQQALPGRQEPSIPYLIEPRSTLVVGPAVPVRWNPVAGAQSYQLWLLRERDRRLLWGRRIDRGSSTVLEPAVGLVPGETYRLVVEADNGTSSQLEACSVPPSFGVLPPADSRVLEQELSEVRGLAAEPRARALLEATVLRQHGLNAAAITTLERQQQQQGASPAVLLQLGHLYGQLGLNQRALESYQRAGQLAAAAGDPETRDEAGQNAAQARAWLAPAAVRWSRP